MVYSLEMICAILNASGVSARAKDEYYFANDALNLQKVCTYQVITQDELNIGFYQGLLEKNSKSFYTSGAGSNSQLVPHKICLLFDHTKTPYTDKCNSEEIEKVAGSQMDRSTDEAG